MKRAPKSVVQSVLARLRKVADTSGLGFNDALQMYVNERFLARLSRTKHAKTVLLKGALMLRVWGIPRARPTMDIDLLRSGDGDVNTLVGVVKDCAAIVDESDGVLFDADTVTAVPIRGESEYVGTRIRLQARLDNVRQTVQIDIGIGDAVHPRPASIEFPVLLGGKSVPLRGYPVEATIAEKFHAMVELDSRNSRMKDFYDIWVLSRTLSFSGETLSSAIRETFRRRATPVPSELPIALTAAYYEASSHARQWKVFAARIGEPGLADQFAHVNHSIAVFLMPAVSCAASGGAFKLAWSPSGPWH